MGSDGKAPTQLLAARLIAAGYAEPGVGGFGEIRRLRQGARSGLIKDGLALADHRGNHGLRSLDNCGARLGDRFVVPYLSTKISRASA